MNQAILIIIGAVIIVLLLVLLTRRGRESVQKAVGMLYNIIIKLITKLV